MPWRSGNAQPRAVVVTIKLILSSVASHDDASDSDQAYIIQPGSVPAAVGT
jgi:hypothetical protein